MKYSIVKSKCIILKNIFSNINSKIRTKSVRYIKDINRLNIILYETYNKFYCI